MVSRDWRLTKLRPKSKLKALIAVSAPSDLSSYGLADVDKEGEITRAKEALADIPVTVIAQQEALTLDRLIDALRAGIDIVYLVCHGVIPRGKDPCLFLQDEYGKTARVMAADLAHRISELTELPRLMVLASCESAGSTVDATAAAQTALAPRLADAGVPAIIAMLGQISMETVKKAVPVFFRELAKDGQIDRAISVARGSVRDRPDSWMPALFLRLKKGRIWYEPGFAGDADQLQTWESICDMVQQGDFMPIVGPEFGESLFGGFREVARQLAFRYKFPMAAHDSADSTKVVQYLTIRQKRAFAESEVQKQVARNIAGDENLRPLNEILDEATARLPDDDPYKILANLAAKIFISASPETALLRSLKSVGKKPEPLACAWRTTDSNHPVEPQANATTDPTPEQPLVYHVFGALGVKDSLVLTEDDFFDYIITTSTYKLIPRVVRGSLVQSSLLFLGFRLDDWTFRVLFRLIMALDGASKMQGYSHVGVQISPDEHTLTDADRAREYLSDYFRGVRVVGHSEPSIDVYWGTPADFLKELRNRLSVNAQPKAKAVAVGAQDGWD